MQKLFIQSECKKRQLAVSGSKQQLMERLKPFEQQILQEEGLRGLNNFNALSPANQPLSASAIDAVIDAVIDASTSAMGEGMEKSGKRESNRKAKFGEWKSGQGKGKQRGRDKEGKEQVGERIIKKTI